MQIHLLVQYINYEYISILIGEEILIEQVQLTNPQSANRYLRQQIV